MSDITTVVDAYLTALAETDAAARAELVAQAWAEDGSFVDPLLQAQGHQALGELADAITGQFPGHTFRRTTGIDAHHGLVRFGWAMLAPDGTVAVDGIDVAIVAADGRLAKVAGFLGDLPAHEAAA